MGGNVYKTRLEFQFYDPATTTFENRKKQPQYGQYKEFKLMPGDDAKTIQKLFVSVGGDDPAVKPKVQAELQEPKPEVQAESLDHKSKELQQLKEKVKEICTNITGAATNKGSKKSKRGSA